jgi:hypothetical protein
VSSTHFKPATHNYAVDFFRGCALLIIFISHMPMNPWFWIMPTRIGFSDAAELFVFCSGVVVAYAYGKTYARAGFGMGVAKTVKRCLELYAAHITLAIMTLWLAFEMQYLTGVDYLKTAHLDLLAQNPGEGLRQLLLLTYVPNLLDILPMYLVTLAMLPFMVLLSRLHPLLMLGTSLSIYLVSWIFSINLIADIETQRTWFFNPFNWQLVFYIGYFIGSGWLNYPKNSKPLLMVCCGLFFIAIPLTYLPLHWQFPILGEWFNYFQPVMHKETCGPLRIIYFLAMAFIARWWAVRHNDFFLHGIGGWIATVGQQSLTVYAVGTLLSFIGGVLIAAFNYGYISTALVNLGGCGLLIALAFMVRWFKRKPWRVAAIPK